MLVERFFELYGNADTTEECNELIEFVRNIDTETFEKDLQVYKNAVVLLTTTGIWTARKSLIPYVVSNPNSLIFKEYFENVVASHLCSWDDFKDLDRNAVARFFETALERGLRDVNLIGLHVFNELSDEYKKRYIKMITLRKSTINWLIYRLHNVEPVINEYVADISLLAKLKYGIFVFSMTDKAVHEISKQLGVYLLANRSTGLVEEYLKFYPYYSKCRKCLRISYPKIFLRCRVGDYFFSRNDEQFIQDRPFDQCLD